VKIKKKWELKNLVLRLLKFHDVPLEKLEAIKKIIEGK